MSRRQFERAIVDVPRLGDCKTRLGIRCTNQLLHAISAVMFDVLRVVKEIDRAVVAP